MARFLLGETNVPASDMITVGTDYLQTNNNGSGNNNNNNYTTNNNGTNFDTNMVIILAALLCALVCALGLNTIVRCALRCGRRVAMEQQEATAAVNLGIKKRTLRKMPVAVYGNNANFPGTECPICLGDFVDGEKVRVLPKCCHGFHVRCIDTWLAAHPSCPTCRSAIIDDQTTDDVTVQIADERR